MDPLQEPLTLPCGAVLRNRLCKAALTEGLANEYGKPTEKHVTLYKKWANSGCGLLITGNMQIDRRYLERAGNIYIDGKQSADDLDRLRKFAKAATQNDTQCWVQVSHAGRQTLPSVNLNPVGPSAVPLAPVSGVAVNTLRELTIDEIEDIVERFVNIATVTKDVGFTGIQLHSAHGYLLSSFLNPRANKRTDQYGGSLENRARLLLAVVSRVRTAVGKSYPISVKLNSSDFQKGGLTFKESIQMSLWLEDLGIDLLEVSGGSYESFAFLGQGVGAKEKKIASNVNDKKRSTALREAYFLEFASTLTKVVTRVPILLTGGFRSRETMEQALAEKDCQVIGVGRPLVGSPDCVKDLLSKKIDSLPQYEETVSLPKWFHWFDFILPAAFIRVSTVISWMYYNVTEMGNGNDPNLNVGAIWPVLVFLPRENAQATALKGMTTVGLCTNAKPVLSPVSKTFIGIGIVSVLAAGIKFVQE